tara:strand:+ start:146 stop:304 length:159 start_codon:yes stop_codon:yes gene_type:complete
MLKKLKKILKSLKKKLSCVEKQIEIIEETERMQYEYLFQAPSKLDSSDEAII